MKVAKLRLRCPTKRPNLLRRRRRKPPPQHVKRSGEAAAAKHLQLIWSAARSFSGSGEASRGTGCQFTAHTASQEASALEMAARSRRGGCCGDWSTGMMCPWEARIREPAAALHVIRNIQVHLKPRLIHQSNPRIKQGSKPAQDHCDV